MKQKQDKERIDREMFIYDTATKRERERILKIIDKWAKDENRGDKPFHWFECSIPDIEELKQKIKETK